MRKVVQTQRRRLRLGVAADPLAGTFPTVEDGVLGVQFVEATVASNAQDGRWVDARLGNL
jgi:hypothetical protein